MFNSCIICDGKYKKIVLNGLDMRECLTCGLIWRASFDLASDYYKELEINLSEKKIEERTVNCIDRMNTLKKIVDLNDLCDVGAGEGIFIKVLRDNGYINVLGIEPNLKINNYIIKNKLESSFISGNVEDINSILEHKNIKNISLFHVIEHLSNPVETLKKIYDYMPQKGKIIIETPDMNSYILKKSGYKDKHIYPEHFFYFNEKNIIRLLTKIGFRMVKSGRRNFNNNNLTITECLTRLWFVNRDKKNYNTKTEINSRNNSEISVIKNSSLKRFVKTILNKCVRILKREDYLWLVAEK